MFLSRLGFVYKDVDVTLYERDDNKVYLLVTKNLITDMKKTQRIKGKKEAYLQWEILHYHYHGHDPDYYSEPPF